MGLFDIFTQPAAQPQPQQQPAPAGNIPAPATTPVSSAGTAPNGVVPNVPAAEQDPKTPLAEYANLWETPTVTTPDLGIQAPPELTHEMLNKAMATVDFSTAITPEMSQAIMQGGEQAAAAFAQAMGAVAKRVMVESTLVSNRLTKQAVDYAVKSTSATLPTTLRTQAATNHLYESNPLFSNPAVKPIVEATQQQLLQKFPNATNAEIVSMTHDYLKTVGAAFNPAPAPIANVNEPDWMAFMGAQ